MAVQVVQSSGQWVVWRTLHNDWSSMQWEIIGKFATRAEAVALAASLPKRKRFRVDYVGDYRPSNTTGSDIWAG